MKLTIQNTQAIVELNGVPARVWEGVTERGTPVTCFITRVAVRNEDDASQFEAELQETPIPAANTSWPTRMTL